MGVLSWISFVVRPLSVEELQHALGVRPTHTDLRRGALPDKEIMVSVCAGLVVIDEESDIIRLVRMYSLAPDQAIQQGLLSMYLL